MVKFLDMAKHCEEIEVDCDRCKYQNECAKAAQYLEDASPIMITKMVQENMEF